MSSKTKTRTSSQASSATSSTPQVPSSSSSVQSPMTPTRMSRIQEKNTLASLNDRLAAYIDRNQQLEQENASFTKQVTQFEQTMDRTVTRVKTEYEKEINSLRKVVDETAKDKRKLEHDYTTIKKDFEDIKGKFDKKSKELNEIQKTLAKIEDSLAQAQNNATRAASERDQLAADKKDLEGEVGRLSREVADLRKKFEQESLGRAELESQLDRRNEELSFSTQLHQQEITEMRTRRQVEIQEVDARAHQEYETKLQEAIQELRAEYEAQLLANKSECENIYDQRCADLKNQVKRLRDTLSSKTDENNTLQLKLEQTSTVSTKIEQELQDLRRKIKELENKSNDDHARFAKMLDTRDNEIDALMKDKTALLNEYQDLMDTKVALDNEIATYRKLLECEEKRLSISPRLSKRGLTPIAERRGTPLRAARKRRIDEESYLEEAQYEVDNKDRGDVWIEEDDREGKFIKLTNKGDKEISLSGWTLTRKSGELEASHKFHRQMKLEAGSTVTIWSSDASGAVHEPPHSLVMKGQKWFPSESIDTVLKDNSGEEVASRSTRRVQSTHQRRRFGFGSPEDLFHQEGEQGQGDRCVIC